MAAEDRQEAELPTSGRPTGSTVSVESRRSMLRRSLGTAAPVVATMMSLPVSAGTCVVASSYVSALTFASRNPVANPYACTITTRSAFLSNTNLNSYLNSTHFGDVFVTPPSSGLAFTSTTKLVDMLKLTTVGGEAEVAWRLVWLFMNLRQGVTMGNMPAGYAQSVWQNYKTNGNSYVLPGIAWSSADLISYLTFVLGA